ncbi:MAG: hypothetical protein AB8E15_07095 [Bdellovibrionales bacterium]
MLNTSQKIHSEIIYLEKLSEAQIDIENSILFYDEVLLENKKIKNFIENFPYKISLTAGEEQKNFEAIARLASKLVELTQVMQNSKPQFVCIGGGSLGDSVGFLASIYRRGCDLVQVPSTWLAAIDSSHGGKTAINFGASKNQFGSFHFPKAVYLIKELLLENPPVLLKDAYSEILKIFLLKGEMPAGHVHGQSLSADDLFFNLPEAVAGKYSFVEKDPFEKTNIRKALNLGHSFGHAVESHYGFSHGTSVGIGLVFCLRFSRNLNEALLNHLSCLYLTELTQIREKPLDSEKLKILFQKDKKSFNKDNIDFVSLPEIGSYEVGSVPISSLVNYFNTDFLEFLETL